MFTKEKRILESLQALRELRASKAQRLQLDQWLATYGSLLQDHGATEALVKSGSMDRAVEFYEGYALGVVAGYRGWIAGVVSFVPVALVLLVRWPSAGPLGVWFFAVFAVMGSIFLGLGYRILRHPQSSTVYTQTTMSGRTNMASGRTGKKGDGILFMALSLVFFTLAVVGDLLFAVPSGL